MASTLVSVLVIMIMILVVTVTQEQAGIPLTLDGRMQIQMKALASLSYPALAEQLHQVAHLTEDPMSVRLGQQQLLPHQRNGSLVILFPNCLSCEILRALKRTCHGRDSRPLLLRKGLSAENVRKMSSCTRRTRTFKDFGCKQEIVISATCQWTKFSVDEADLTDIPSATPSPH